MKNKYNLLKNKKAFTLVEVLVTLAVIGVVAALTIPSLISNTGEKKYHTMWKKQFNVLNNSLILLSDNMGTIDFTNKTTMRDSFEEVMPFIQKDEWKDLSAGYYNYYKNNSAGANYSSPGFPAATLKDGSVWLFVNENNCSGSYGSLTNVCGYVFIDVNGKKSPNMFGKDLFQAWIRRESGTYKAYPIGYKDGIDGYTCEVGSTDFLTSDGCSTYALLRDPADMP